MGRTSAASSSILASMTLLALAMAASAGGGGHASGPDAIQPGETLERVFQEPGTYTYHCEPHPDMVGTVEVVAGDAPSDDANTTSTKAVNVIVAKMQFDPSALRVYPGTHVVWHNNDQVGHTVTFDDPATAPAHPSDPHPEEKTAGQKGPAKDAHGGEKAAWAQGGQDPSLPASSDGGSDAAGQKTSDRDAAMPATALLLAALAAACVAATRGRKREG